MPLSAASCAWVRLQKSWTIPSLRWRGREHSGIPQTAMAMLSPGGKLSERVLSVLSAYRRTGGGKRAPWGSFSKRTPITINEHVYREQHTKTCPTQPNPTLTLTLSLALSRGGVKFRRPPWPC